MKVDGLAVVLAIILLPIILVVTYYIQLQVDTIATENTYNTNLLDATYDAMSAFEINTANEQLSSVADSMRSIVLASNNIFLNTLATNFGVSNASKEYIQPYIPAVLYTMYDGYYIYAPTETAIVAEKKESVEGSTDLQKTTGYLSVGEEKAEEIKSSVEGYDDAYYGDIIYEKENGGYTVNKEHAKKDTDYILKSYVQYSARYKKGSTKDVTINYTLDNYLNIVGTIGDVYYTKTGYLIKDGLVTNATIGADTIDLKNYNEDDAKNRILGIASNAEELRTVAADSASVEVNGVEITSNFKNIKDKIFTMTNQEIFSISEAETQLAKIYEAYNVGNLDLLEDIRELEYEIQNCKAVAYYISSACFSNWVYANLSDLTYGDIQDNAMSEYYGDTNYTSTSGAGESDLYYNFSGNDTPIFRDDAHPDPEDTESNFNTHKMEVIKNSIKYNLNLSMSAYSKMEHPYECSLPVLLDEEWDKILSNISIVSFMQGWDCGLDVFNSYQIVSSTNNELTVTPSEIYYVKKSNFNKEVGSYHRIDCKYLKEEYTDSPCSEYIAFKSKEVKYDKVYDKSTGDYKYDHRNLACYTCINTNNYTSLFKSKNDKWYEDNDKKYTSYYDRISSLENDELKVAGYIGIAKERQNIYKTNALPVSEGYKIVYKNDTAPTTNGGNFTINCEAKKVKKLQITISDTKSNNTSGTKEPVLNLNIKVNGKDYPVSLNLDQKKEQTLTIDVSDIDGAINAINLTKTSPNYNVEYKVKSIKAIYK